MRRPLQTCMRRQDCLMRQVGRVRFAPAKTGSNTFGWMEIESAEAALSIVEGMNATISQLKRNRVRPLVHHVEMSGRPMLKGVYVQVGCN